MMVLNRIKYFITVSYCMACSSEKIKQMLITQCGALPQKHFWWTMHGPSS